MIALTRYTMATLLHSQRYVPPLLLFLGAVGMFSSNDTSSLAPIYATCAAAMFVCSSWLTVALTSIEDPTHRMIVVVTAGSSVRVLGSTVVVAVLGSLVFLIAGLTFPLIFGQHEVTGLDLLVGAMAQMACASVGIAIGLICSRLVIRRQGYAVIVALGLTMVALFTPGLPPVNAMFRLMGKVSDPQALLGPVVGFLALGLALLAVSAVATRYVTSRRD